MIKLDIISSIMSSGHKVSGLVFSGNLEMSGYKSDMNLKADYIEDKATVMWVGLNNDQMFEKLANSVEKSQEVHLILYDSGNDNSLPAIVKNDNASEGESSSVKGGWVKEPIRGMATWTACYDFASLYPTTMRQFNISADSYKGQKIKNENYALFNGHQIELDPDDIITKNGAVFKNEEGVVTQVLGDIYSQRSHTLLSFLGKVQHQINSKQEGWRIPPLACSSTSEMFRTFLETF